MAPSPITAMLSDMVSFLCGWPSALLKQLPCERHDYGRECDFDRRAQKERRQPAADRLRQTDQCAEPGQAAGEDDHRAAAPSEPLRPCSRRAVLGGSAELDRHNARVDAFLAFCDVHRL